MTMPWNDPSAYSTRRARPNYLPPHLREQHQNSPFSPRSPPSRGRRRRSGGGRNQPGSYTRTKRNLFDQNSFDSPEDFDISERFDKLDVGDEDVNAYDSTPVETSGFDVPAPVTSFADIPFCKALRDNIKRCKYVKPTPIQRYAIPVAMAGRDVMACAQTGSGKTAAFCFPIISGILKDHSEGPTEMMTSRAACPLALILTPTRELSCQIHEETKKFSYQTGVKVSVAYGGAPIAQQLRSLEKGVDLLVATPGRLADMIERDRVSLSKVKYLTLDEADRMLDMGFEPQIRKLVQYMDMPPPGVRQTLLFSATFPTEIQRLASDFLSNYVFLAAGKIGSSTGLIAQRVEYVHDMDKRKHLMNLLQAQRANGNEGKHALTLIFVETKKGADALQQWLSMKHFRSIAIHGDKVQMERERALRSFRTGQTPILVATDVAARGLDIPHVAHVVNFDLPRDIDDYVHRIGRTGRAGKTGLATAFFSTKNAPLAKGLVELMQEANQEIPPWLSEYVETSHSSFRPQGSRSGAIKFGGHDYRRGATKNAESYDSSNLFSETNFPYSHSAGAYTYHSSGADFSASAAQDSFVDGMHHHSYGSAVATGWN